MPTIHPLRTDSSRSIHSDAQYAHDPSAQDILPVHEHLQYQLWGSLTFCVPPLFAFSGGTVCSGWKRRWLKTRRGCLCWGLRSDAGTLPFLQSPVCTLFYFFCKLREPQRRRGERTQTGSWQDAYCRWSPADGKECGGTMSRKDFVFLNHFVFLRATCADDSFEGLGPQHTSLR